MPKKLKMRFPVVANINKMMVATRQATRAIRMRSLGGSLGVIARNAGTVAIGSMITNNEPTASRTYAYRSMMMPGNLRLVSVEFPRLRRARALLR